MTKPAEYLMSLCNVTNPCHGKQSTPVHLFDILLSVMIHAHHFIITAHLVSF